MRRKLKRIIALIAAYATFCTVLALDMMPTSVYAATDAEYNTLRNKWVEYLTGGDYISEGEVYTTYIQSKVKSVEDAAKNLLNTMAPVTDFYRLDYIWPNRQVGNAMDMTVRSARNMSYNFEHLETLALAYKTKGSRYEGNAELAEKIIAGLNFMYDRKYNENVPRSDRKNSNDNWYEWEIRAPQCIENTLALMYDEIDQELIDKLQRGIDKQVPGIGTAATGSNRLNNCLAAIVGGIVQKNPDRVKMGTDALATEMDYSTIDDGFYEDGSFIQHHQYPYNGAYGSSALQSIAKIVYLLENSSFAANLPDIQNIYQWVYDSFEPLQYEGKLMDSVRGRSISRVGDKGYGLMESLVILSQFAPEPHNSYYKSMIKRLATNNTTINPYNQVSSIFTITKLYEILTDPSVTAKEDMVFYKNFGAMDRAVSFRENYAFNVSMYSDRIRNYESINGENLQGWHTAAGMTYLFNDEITQYDDAYWATVDRHRLSGTTVVKGSESPNALYGDSYAGGVGMDDQYGVNAMRYLAPDDAKGKHDLRAQKAWFMFDDEVVALGSGITSTEAKDAVETIVDNRKIESFGKKLSVNGTELSTQTGTKVDFPNAKWAFLEGNPAKTLTQKNTNIGYYFPDGCTLHTLRESRTDSWSSVGTGSSQKLTKNYVSLAVDHGTKPNNDTYSYVLLPGRTEQEVKNYSEQPDIEILANTEDLQVVRENRLGITGAAVWNDEGQSFADITCYQPATMMVKETEDTIKISVSDPTQSQKTLSFDLRTPVGYVLSMDNGMSVSKQGDATKVVVNVTGGMGKAFAIEWSKKGAGIQPPAPAHLTAEAITPAAVTLSWDAEDGAVQYYPVFCEEEDGVYAPVPNYNGTDTTYIHQGLAPEKTYYYKIAVNNGQGISDYSAPISVTTPKIPPSPGAVSEFYESFENCFVGPFAYQTDLSVSFGMDEKNTAQIIQEENGNHVLRLTADARDTANADTGISRKMERMTSNFVVEGDFTIIDDGWKNLVYLTSNNTVAVQVYAQEGNLITYNGKEWNTKHPFNGFTYQKGVPFHLRVEVDMKNQMFKVIVNGKELEYSVDEPLTFRNRVNYIDKFESNMTDTRGIYQIDNLHVGGEITPLSIEVWDLNNIPVSKIQKGGVYTVRPRYQNNGEEKDAVCIVAVKEGNNLVDFYKYPLTVPADNTTTPRIKIQVDKKLNFNNVYIECYLWKSMDSMEPLSAPIQFGK